MGFEFKKMTIIYVIIGVIAVIVLWIIFTFNRLITLKNRVKEAWADIEVQLKRRYDLIPNLMETVKGYAAHERNVLENVTKARVIAMGAKTAKERGEAENMLSSALKSLFAVAENYPDLKASQNFLELQRELRDTEDKIQAARRFYNANVMALNTKIEVFPANIIAKIFRFRQAEFFELEEPEAKKPVKISF